MIRSPQSSRSGPSSRVLLRPRFAFALAVGGALLVASLTLPSSFDDTFEILANHGRAEKALEEKKGTSTVHVAIAGVVPKYDGKMEDSKWWGDAGAPLADDAQGSPKKGAKAAKKPWLLSALQQHFFGAYLSPAEDGGPISYAGSPETASGPAGLPNLLALNPLGDVQTRAAALPPSASFHASGIPLRENGVAVDDGSGGSGNLPALHAWNNYGSVPIVVGEGSLAFNSTPSPASPIAPISSSAPSSPVVDNYAPFSVSASTPSAVSAPVPVSSPVVQPVVPSAPSPTVVQQPALRLARVSSIPTTSIPITFMPAALSSTTTGTPTRTLVTAASAPSANIGYQFVTVGNPGNANDPATGNFYGGVNYNYDIGQYDVTLTQYCAFLNAVAAVDTYGLYNGNMASDGHVAGISQTGVNGTYQYSVIGDGQRPVTYVSWFDAARFANWVNNGQPSGLGEVNGSTETGAYTLRGALTGVVSKNANAQVWIPTESEWYKAAYYDPTLNGGAGGYWSDAAQSNSPPGNTVGSQPNQGNYFNGTYSTGGVGNNYLTDVGAFSMSMSPYGTFDQMGDVYQWNDAIVGPNRGFRGGAWDSLAYTYLLSTDSNYGDPTQEMADLGFRLATIPEPAAWSSLLGGLGLLAVRRRHRKAA